LNGIYGWLAEASGEQKRTLVAAFLGYMLDSMDVMLYALVLGQVQREMHLSAALSGAMVSATLIAAAAGGVASIACCCGAGVLAVVAGAVTFAACGLIDACLAATD